ncbi:hypothetical protein [Oryzicola mucosus]|uniref:Uncharacterized protein n=1 Tax=Oryzicola mucosus TaxID=2767425 RepID=A0A8J6PSZ9_9HYPH|nr:hypothetical protein [Oryzicola mucosus]MBD0413228.1 hypothetical protein [Oryzicola mucosus]
MKTKFAASVLSTLLYAQVLLCVAALASVVIRSDSVTMARSAYTTVSAVVSGQS